jgi:ribosomal protein S12 methylthiotransferase
MIGAAVVTLGCPKNEVDSENMKGLLEKNGYCEEKNISKADIIIVNTCGFIEDAKQESINTILEMGKNKKNGRCRLLIVSGCLAQRYPKELMREIPEIDALVGTTGFMHIVDIIKDALDGKRSVCILDESLDIPENLPRTCGENRHYRYLRIAEGCSNYCSYCIIPKIRGRYRSRREEYIIEEAKSLTDEGARELILVAQDITNYGSDLYGHKRLAQLLSKLCSVDNMEWLRLLYCYPEGITEELIHTVKSLDKICKYLDIPVQHASDRILKRMNRRITGTEIERLLYRLREQIPGIVLRSTVIVGFPGEKDEDFKEVLSLVEKGYFDRLGVFTYSREEDTPAFHMKEHVPHHVALRRRETLMLEQQKISLGKNSTRIGKRMRIIVDGRESELYYGRTYGDAPDVDNRVLFTSKGSVKTGDFVEVEIDHALEYDLVGRVVE